jgi:hypothetical protein
MILGLRIRALDVDAAVAADNTGLSGEGLRAAVKEDHAQGLHPFVLSELQSRTYSVLTGRDMHNSCYGRNNIIGRH